MKTTLVSETDFGNSSPQQHRSALEDDFECRRKKKSVLRSWALTISI